jgi:hypothetical protein
LSVLMDAEIVDAVVLAVLEADLGSHRTISRFRILRRWPEMTSSLTTLAAAPAATHSEIPSPVTILLVVAAVGYVLWSRMQGRPLKVKRMLVLPVVLVVLGITMAERKDWSQNVPSPGPADDDYRRHDHHHHDHHHNHHGLTGPS